MKKNLIFLLLFVLTTTIFAETAYLVTGSSTQSNLNILKVSYFDPSQPYSQPILFNLNITTPDKAPDDVSDRAEYDLNIKLFWNGNELTGTSLSPIEGFSQANQFSTSFNVTNRDVITSNDNRFFEADNNFSFDDVMENNSQFEDFLLETGRFPDGQYRIEIELVPENPLYQGDSTIISFSVRGIQSVRIISPGVLAGSTNIPLLAKPIIFNWTSSGYNNAYVIQIKEFDQPYELDPSNLEFNGRVVEEEWVNNMTVYNPSYNFQEGKYYAWKAKVKYIGEESLNQEDFDQYLSSSYHVFQFACAPTSEVPNAFQEELENNLLNLNIAEITALLESGYLPKDGIQLNGKTIYGKEAVDRIRDLFSTFEIEVSVE